MPTPSREIHLVRRPEGPLQSDDFRLIEAEVADPADIVDPLTKESYTRDPRNIAKKAEAYLKDTKVGDTAFFGPEAEFFIFDDVRVRYGTNMSFHHVDSVEGVWNTGRDEDPDLGQTQVQRGILPRLTE